MIGCVVFIGFRCRMGGAACKKTHACTHNYYTSVCSTHDAHTYIHIEMFFFSSRLMCGQRMSEDGQANLVWGFEPKSDKMWKARGRGSGGAKGNWARKEEVGRGRREIMWLMWRSPLFTRGKASPTLLLSTLQIPSFSISCFPNSLLTSSPSSTSPRILFNRRLISTAVPSFQGWPDFGRVEFTALSPPASRCPHCQSWWKMAAVAPHWHDKSPLSGDPANPKHLQ